MGLFTDLLNGAQSNLRPMALIASLPLNNPELAKAALEAGADAVKVHINLHHHASGQNFGSLAEERPALEQIAALWAGRPCGIVAGGSAEINPIDLNTLPELGFNWISLYCHHAPVGLLPPREKIERMIAVSYQDAPALATSLQDLGIDALELSIMDPDTYTQPFTYRDLALYKAYSLATRLPLVAPTQHRILPEAVPMLLEAGISGLMLGTIVAGSTPQSWFEAVSIYKKEIEKIFQ